MIMLKSADFHKLGSKFSKSEERGMSLLSENDRVVFCPGVSTGGFAEMRMATGNPRRRIIATTIDRKGLQETRNILRESGFSKQVEIRYEDVRKPMPYRNDYFDFIYARCILHYLSKQELDATLKEMHRVLKPRGRFFIVAKSKDDWESSLEGSRYDKLTGMITYPVYDSKMRKTDRTQTRYFHSKKTISAHLEKSGFKILGIRQYKEQLYHDYMRTIPTPKLSGVIEVVAQK